MMRFIFSLAAFVSLIGVSLQQTCGAAYAQCGGVDWTGATCCVSGYYCYETNEYYSQCIPGSASGSSSSSTTSTSSTTSKAASSSSSSTASKASTTTTAAATTGGASIYTTTDTATVASHTQLPYPSVDASTCGDWTLVDNVCCPLYCSNQNESQTCDSTCTGSCITPPAADCMSGTMWGQQYHVTTNETWHYSRSTHFGLTDGGACGFGLYGLCTQGSTTASWTDPLLGDTCTAFCAAYPLLCSDPSDLTLRGNFAAPNGDYYTQFWTSQVGDWDNYLSCGECFELIRTKADGTDYAVGEDGYTDPIYLEVVDSCPCDANSKWCCGPGADHCGEIDFTYGCPLPAGSHHMDLSDIAMGRLQGNGSLAEGVIPIRYRRVQCPKPGNVYIWLRDGGGPYYFELTAVNANGPGSVTKIEIKGAGDTNWTALINDPNYTSSRPQERYGGWTIPSGSGPFNVPLGVRITSPTGQQIVNEALINSFTPPSTAQTGFYYIDFGAQFSED